MRAPAGSVKTLDDTRPGSVLGRGAGPLLALCILVSFVVSPALLHVLGVRYASSAGSVFEKLHLATLLAALAVGVSISVTGRLRFSFLSAHAFYVALLLICLAAAQLLVLQRPLTGLLVTFLTPVLLVYLLQLADEPLRLRLRGLVTGLVLLNSLVGLAEFALQMSLLPRVAGAELIASDGRALGLVGNPLSAAFLCGLMLVYLLISRLMTRFDLSSVLQIGVHGAALIVFGGRLALLAALLMLAIYLLFDGTALLRRRPVERWLIRYCLAAAAIVGAAAAYFTGLADQLMARFFADGGSAETRWAALRIAQGLDLDEVLLGLSPVLRDVQQQRFATPYGIEITWIAWLVDYGIFISLGLTLVLALVLHACLRGAARVHVYMAGYFLICMTGAQGLGAKSLLLTWLVILLLLFRQPHSLPSRIAPN